MNSIAVGNAVSCGICGRETTVSFITDRQGTPGYDLECMHRNAYCDTCGKLVKDASESIHEVVPACRTCNADMFEEDLEEDDEVTL